MVKVCSYNIHCGIGNDGAYDLTRIAGVLRRSGCDIACLQEVEVNFVSRKQRKWSHEHCDNQAELLAKATGLGYFSFAGPLRAHTGEYRRECLENPFDEVLVRDSEGKSGYGNAILSRYPIIESRALVFELMETPRSEEYIFMDREEQPRGARAILVDVGSDPGESKAAAESSPPPQCCTGGPKSPQKREVTKTQKLMWIVNSHLSHKLSSREQRSQSRQLVDWIDALVNEYDAQGQKPGYVLCGDLNAPSFAPLSSYSTILGDSRWADSWKEQGTMCNQATFPLSCCGPACGVKLDHILVLNRPGAAKIECQATRVLGDAADVDASDHCAVIADLQVSSSSD